MPRLPPSLYRPGLAATLLVVAVACGDDAPEGGATSAPPAPPTSAPTSSSDPTTTSSDPDPPATVPAPLESVVVDLEVLAQARVPTAHALHPDGTGWVTEKAGRVVGVPNGEVALDVSGRVLDRGEQGMLGLAFDASGDHLYVSYTDRADTGASVVAEYLFTGGRADPATERELLRVAQPRANHNGGDIHLGPDGMLWVALGDGGGRGDPDDNAQDPTTLLGSVLRIDPRGTSDGRAYTIPPDNPFADGGGAPEVWLHGVRNPWRLHFDRETGDLWVADVGQNRWEEIDLLPAPERGRGANLGWNRLEGTHPFQGSAPAGAVPPVYEYSQDEGCSVTGGVVYRGRAMPGLIGAYLFGDFCRSDLRAIRVVDGTVVDAHTFPVDAGTPIAFGVDVDGEVLVLSQDGDIARVVPG